MNLRRLQALVEVVEAGSFSAAASRLGLSQPAVSQQIKGLEEELGTVLLDRSAAGVQLTTAGQAVHQRARRILDLWEETLQELRRLQQGLSGRLVVGASSIPGTYLLPRLLGPFTRRYPDVKFSLRTGDSAAMAEEALNRTVDLAVIGAPARDRRLVNLELPGDRLQLVAPPGHPLAAAGRVPIESITKEPFVLREPGSGTRAAMEQGLARCGIKTAELNVSAEVGSTEGVLAAVSAGLGLSFVSSLAADPAVAARRVAAVELNCPPLERRFYVVHHTTKAEDPLVQAFLRFCRESCPEQDGDSP